MLTGTALENLSGKLHQLPQPYQRTLQGQSEDCNAPRSREEAFETPLPLCLSLQLASGVYVGHRAREVHLHQQRSLLAIWLSVEAGSLAITGLESCPLIKYGAVDSAELTGRR